MKLADVSIRRPVFATMMMMSFVIFGAVLYLRLPVDMFPDVDFPVVTVTVVYPGADPATMEEKVADPIEEAVNSLGGIEMLRSVSVGSVTQVIIQFDLDTDLDTATQDVRDRVAAIQDQLPDGAETPTVQKLDLGASPIMQIAIAGDAGDLELSRFAEDVVKPALERIQGVGQLELVGGRDREVHVYVDPDRLRGYGLTINEVVQALGAQNLEVPGGRVDTGAEELTLVTSAQAGSIEELRGVTITARQGAVVRLSDVANVVDGLEERRSAAYWMDGAPAIALVVRKQSGANTVEVAERVREVLPALREQAPPGTRIDVLLDNSVQIRGSIEQVQFDLAIGALLAVAIIFLFLRDWRATLISALTLPTCVIGTFAFVQAMGFTLNLMTTLALSLSIGILIDDAIVVIENIVRHRTALGEGPMKAASKGTAEIGLAVLAVSASIVAVFIPVAFMDGMIGRFFYQFGLTVAFAVALSLFVSLTLTPMLSSRLLKPHEGTPKGLSGLVERILNGLDAGYRRLVAFALRQRILTSVVAIAALGGAFALAPNLGFEFMPIEDRGQFSVNLEMPVGTSLDVMEREANAVAADLGTVPGVTSTFTTIGGGVQERVNTANILVTLDPRDTRAFHQTEAMAYMRRMLADRSGLNPNVQPLQIVSMGTATQAVQFNLRGDDLEELETAANAIAERLRQTEGFVDVDTTYRSGRPELELVVDRERADDLGVLGAQVAGAVRALISGVVATQYDSGDDRYDVRVQLPPELRRSEDAVRRSQVRSTTGALVEVEQVASVIRTTGPNQIDREARQRQITVLANLEDKPLGTALDEVRAIAADVVPDHITTDIGGMGKRLEETITNMGIALFLAIACIYLILASQFESFIHPLTIMVSLPFALIGAFGGLLLLNHTMSIFAMIGFIMLMGLVTKNAILLVDYANQLRERGEPILEALENAGATRLRPILMTTAAMIFGMLPVAIGHGDGGEMRAPMGVAVVGGLITSTVLTLIVVPVFYTFMDAIGSFFARVFGIKGREDGDEHSEGAPSPEPAE